MSLQVHSAVGWALVLVTLGMIGFWVPPEVEGLRGSYLIFFFHFPSAINCLNFFVIAGLISAVYLCRPRRSGLDLWAATAVEVGVVACTVTLVTGSIWAKCAWNTFWNFRDKRLLTVAIMWFTYLGYLALRSTLEDPEKRSRFCAVFAVIAALNVPLVFFALRWFPEGRTHPMEVDLRQTSMIVTRWVGTLAFLLLYTALWRLRHKLSAVRHSVDQLEESYGRVGI